MLADHDEDDDEAEPGSASSEATLARPEPAAFEDDDAFGAWADEPSRKMR